MQQPAADRPIPTVLTIAGADSSGGAGIAADLATIAAHGLHGACAITAVTAQTAGAVTAVHACPAAVVGAQIEAAFAGLEVRAVKIGMLADAAIVDLVSAALSARPDLPVVLDPVLLSSSGTALLADDARQRLLERLLPRASVITPNLPEAAALLGWPAPPDEPRMPDACAALRALGARAVLLKGGHLPDGDPLDLLDDGTTQWFRHRRQPLSARGTGCTLASAIACGLARGRSLPEACADATVFLQRSLAAARQLGPGSARGLDHAAGRPD